MANYTIVVIWFIKIFFIQFSFVYSFHLFFISSASTRSLPFLSFILPIFWWNSPLMFPIFLKRSLVFPLLLFSSIIKHCSLKKVFLSYLAIFWNSAFNWMYSPFLFAYLHSSAICKALSENHFAFLLFFFFGMILFTTYCTILQTSVHSSSDKWLTRSSSLNIFVISTVNS